MTTRFAAANASDPDWQDATDDCIAQLAAQDAVGMLGFLYVSDPFAGRLDAIADRLRVGTGITEWVGTVGFGVCGQGRGFFDAPAISVLTADLPDRDYRVVPTLTRPGDAAAPEVTSWVRDRHPLLGVMHGDPSNAYLPDIIDSFADDTDCFLVGGLTASRAGFAQLAGRSTQGGLSGILFAGDIPVASGLTQGCSPVGPIREVTSGDDNVILELDGKPAFEQFRADVGDDVIRDSNRLGAYAHIALPIQGSDTADYLVRNIVGIDPASGAISIGDRLSVGDRLMFVRRDREAAEQDLGRMLQNLSRRAGGTPKAGLYFSCVARGPNLFDGPSWELAEIKRTLGDFPLAGFFANGEISNGRLYGYTGVLTLFL